MEYSYRFDINENGDEIFICERCNEWGYGTPNRVIHLDWCEVQQDDNYYNSYLTDTYY